MSISMQDVIGKLRSGPRVHLNYKVETNGATVKENLPCKLGIIANIAGATVLKKKYNQRDFINLSPDNWQEVMKGFAPSLEIIGKLKISSALKNEKNAEFSMRYIFSRIKDFTPDAILDKIPQLKEFHMRIQLLTDLLTSIQNSDVMLNIALKFIAEGGDIKSILETAKVNNRDIFLKRFLELEKLNLKKETTKNELYWNLNLTIRDMNLVLSDGLDQVLHNKDFQKLEGTWLGIKHLMNEPYWEKGKIEIHILPASLDEIENDIVDAIAADSSHLFRLIYANSYGSYGGIPFTAIGMDYDMKNTSQHMGIMRKLTGIMASSHTPTIIGSHPELFGINSFQNLSRIRVPESLFQGSEYAEFNTLRSMDDSRYLGMTMLRVMARIPYGNKTMPVKSFTFYNENITGIDYWTETKKAQPNATLEKKETGKADNKKKKTTLPNGNENNTQTKKINPHNLYTWRSPMFDVIQRISNSYFLHGWFSEIIGCRNGGKVQNLPAYLFKNEDNTMVMKCATETFVTERDEYSYSSLGFIVPCAHKTSNEFVFFSMKSLNSPVTYDTRAATMSAQISSGLQYMLNASRFAHYLKVMVRNKIGSYTNASTIQMDLSRWIMQYVMLNDTTDQALRAKYPLKRASIAVTNDPNRLGFYVIVIHLQPAFQLEGATISLRWVEELLLPEDAQKIVEREALLMKK